MKKSHSIITLKIVFQNEKRANFFDIAYPIEDIIDTEHTIPPSHPSYVAAVAPP